MKQERAGLRNLCFDLYDFIDNLPMRYCRIERLSAELWFRYNVLEKYMIDESSLDEAFEDLAPDHEINFEEAVSFLPSYLMMLVAGLTRRRLGGRQPWIRVKDRE